MKLLMIKIYHVHKNSVNQHINIVNILWYRFIINNISYAYVYEYINKIHNKVLFKNHQ